MSFIYPALGAAVAVAGGDKLAGERSYRGMFHRLGWSQGRMRTVAAVEVIGGLLMLPRTTRRVGGAMVAGVSAAVLDSELRNGDWRLGAARALLLVSGVCALLAPGD